MEAMNESKETEQKKDGGKVERVTGTGSVLIDVREKEKKMRACLVSITVRSPQNKNVHTVTFVLGRFFLFFLKS